MKHVNKLFFLPAFVLLIALGIKLLGWPNHVLYVAGGLLLVLVLLIVYSATAIAQAGAGQKFIHFLFIVLSFVVIVLPFVGMFQQGLIPILIYFVLFFCVVAYFYTGNPALRNPHAKQQARFVFIHLILVMLNSPFTHVLPDKFYSPPFHPKYEQGKGTAIFIDEAHHNYHTHDGLYTTFANVLRKDGYVVSAFEKRFTNESLQDIKILVIANALHEKNVDTWKAPVHPAFDEQEVQSLKAWVEKGGSLFLIADHPPFSSAAKSLGAAFGFVFSDKTAEQKERSRNDLFCRKNKMLKANEITNGNSPTKYVDSIVTFTGQAFKIPDSAVSILTFDSNYAAFTSRKQAVKPEDITGLSQGAYMKYGKGRLVVFGEAAMFSGQLGAGLSWVKIGMNSRKAKNNYKLLLNLVHWLDRQ